MKTFTITLTEQDCLILGQALGTLPYKDVFELITRLNSQLVAQQMEKVSDPMPRDHSDSI